RAVFGVLLADAVALARPGDATTELPAVVYRCLQYLTAQNAVAEEGIFRLSGSNTVIKALRDRFNAEGDVDLRAAAPRPDIHAVASLLKLYLRELPASILTRELHLEFLRCLDLHRHAERVVALNGLVGRLPAAHRALLAALAGFLGGVVGNAEVNKMNVRNVGIVFAPTLNVPAPLISAFVEEQGAIFGPPLLPAAAADDDDAESPAGSVAELLGPAPTELRSPRKQMFSDLPTPAYHQTSFPSPQQGLNGYYSAGGMGGDVGMIPMQPSYASYQMAPQGEGGFGSLNEALRSPTTAAAMGYAGEGGGGGALTAPEIKSRRRESAMAMGGMGPAGGGGVGKNGSMTRLREEAGASF
ncbi:Rho GTPase activating protein, partial [Teratosphaeriaceae sp. CCFEE 6253]